MDPARRRWNMPAHGVALLLALAAGASSACHGGERPSPPPGVVVASLAVTSRAFAANGAIPIDCTCDGADRSPPIAWSAPPEGTRALAVLVDDPDAIGGDFTQWLAYNIAPGAVSLPEGVDATTLGADEGTNSFGRVGYAGPCPPRHEMHRYEFHVFALNARLTARPGATRDALEEAMSQHVLAEGSLVGTFAH
jgi:Raf kinase inhibitor-like YbhB/YbcL family protein